ISSEVQSLGPATTQRLSETLDEASYATRVTQGTASLTYQPSTKDNITLEAGSRIFRYDTPNEQNHDDHDELLSNTRLIYGRQFSPALFFSSELRLSRSHLVYLKSDRSAQNNVTRT